MTTLTINSLYQLRRLPIEERLPGVVYLHGNRVFRLLAVEDKEAWVKCTITFKTFIVNVDRLINF